MACEPRVNFSMRELDRLKCIQGLIDGQLKQHARERRAARPCSKPRAHRQYFGELIQIDGSSDPDAHRIQNPRRTSR
jgi:hypothetical protein